MKHRLVEAPSADVISVADMQRHLGLAADEHVDFLADAIAQAVRLYDGPTGLLGMALAPQTWEVTLHGLTAEGVELTPGPVIEVLAVATDAAPEGWGYGVSGGRIYALDDPLPAEIGVVVTFRAGFEADGSSQNPPYPPMVLRLIRMTVAEWFAHREEEGYDRATLPADIAQMAARLRGAAA